MKKYWLQGSILVAISAFSFQVMAKDIRITVKTEEKTAIAVGFKVYDKQKGGLGKKFTGWGPANAKYNFGFRKDSIAGEDIDCGSLVLWTDSVVTMEYKNGICTVVGEV